MFTLKVKTSSKHCPLTLTACEHQRYDGVQRRRAVVTIWDAVVETLTTLSNFQ